MWTYCVRAKSVNPVNEIISSHGCNSATEIQNIRVWCLHIHCVWSRAAFHYLLLQSLDNPCVCFWWPKAASLISFIFRRNRVGKNLLPENHLALRPSKYNHLLNLLSLWFFFFIWNYFSATVPFWAQAVELFFNLPFTEEQCFKHLTIFFSPLVGEPQALTLVTTQDVLKLAHTFIYFRLDYCEPWQAACSDAAVLPQSTQWEQKFIVFLIFKSFF